MMHQQANPAAGETANERALVLFVGRIGDPAWRDQVAWLRDRCELVCCASCQAAQDWLQDTARCPVLVVLAEAHRDTCTAAEVHRLFEQLPLSRMFVVQGSLCEGEARSGTPYEGVEHAYWYHFQARVAALLELDGMATGSQRQGGAAIVRTGTEQERVLEESERPLPVGDGLIGIVADSLIFVESLESGCRLAGYHTTWLRPGGVQGVAGMRAIIVDCHDVAGALDLTSTLPAEVQQMPRLVLANFPRLEDVQQAAADGRTVVVAKPFRLHDVLWQLSELLAADEETRAA